MNRHTLITGLISATLVGVAQAGATQTTPLNFIAIVQGNARIQRANWLGPLARFHPLQVGTLVKGDDRLKLEPGATAIVMCNNLSQWQVPVGKVVTVSQGCPTHNSRLFRPDSPRTNPRTSAVDATLPYILSPRHSAVMTGQPTLRWNAVVGAQTYRVQVGKSGGFRWETEAREPTIVYDGEPLRPGGRYWLMVATDNAIGCTHLDYRSDCRTYFSVLSEAEAQQVQADAEQVQATLDGEAGVLALAHLYRSHKLYADAITILEAYRQATEVSSVAVDHLLADLYGDVELWQQAESLYLEVLAQYHKAENLDGEVTILTHLTAFYETQMGPTDAKTITHQEQLKSRLQALGAIEVPDNDLNTNE